MKKILFIGLFFIILVFKCNAQGVYSKENLEKGTLVGLNFNLKKAQNLKKTGIFLCITGPVLTVGGLAIAANTSPMGSDSKFVIGSFLFIGGIAATVIGLSVLITGLNRVKRVKTAINNKQELSLNITPSFVYTNNAQNIYPGLTLRARF